LHPMPSAWHHYWVPRTGDISTTVSSPCILASSPEECRPSCAPALAPSEHCMRQCTVSPFEQIHGTSVWDGPMEIDGGCARLSTVVDYVNHDTDVSPNRSCIWSVAPLCLAEFRWEPGMNPGFDCRALQRLCNAMTAVNPSFIKSGLQSDCSLSVSLTWSTYQTVGIILVGFAQTSRPLELITTYYFEATFGATFEALVRFDPVVGS
jgi:hypothetical protein